MGQDRTDVRETAELADVRGWPDVARQCREAAATLDDLAADGRGRARGPGRARHDGRRAPRGLDKAG
jgi:hypothetical protein